MDELREAKLGASVGRKRIGKTYQAMLLIQKYVRGIGGINAKPRKVLILDVNDEFGDYEALNIDDIARYAAHPKIEIRRIRPIYPHTGRRIPHNDMQRLLFYAAENFRGGLLIAEDINKYIGDHPTDDIMGMFCSNAHADLDILLHFQSIGRLTPKIWQNLNYIRFFKNAESVDKHEKKFPERYEMMKIVELMVNKQYEEGNKRFNVFVDLDDDKIKGEYTKEIFIKAIDTYISNNFLSLKRDKESYFDNSKGKIIKLDTTQIFLELRKEKYINYCGNF